jgi:Tol biopolymer transport system component
MCAASVLPSLAAPSATSIDRSHRPLGASGPESEQKMHTPRRMSRPSLGLMVVVVLVAALVCAFMVVSAGAKAPGSNGRIAFEQADPASKEGDTFVFTANPDGSDIRKLVPSHTCCAAWAPDGNKISIAAATKDDRITTATVNPDGSDYNVMKIPAPTLNLECPVWSPDGDRLACEGWDEVHPRRPKGLFSVRTSDFGGLVRLTRNPYGGPDTPGDYSPDGTRIAFLRGRPHRPEDQVAVFVAKSDGNHIRRLTRWGRTGCCKVSWSPDGRKILFSNGRGSLLTVRPNGTGLRKIPIDLDGRFFAFIAGWSPDGQRIGFTLCRRRCNIYTMRPDGTDVVRLTNTRRFKEFGDWGPSPVTP